MTESSTWNIHPDSLTGIQTTKNLSVVGGRTWEANTTNFSDITRKTTFSVQSLRSDLIALVSLKSSGCCYSWHTAMLINNDAIQAYSLRTP